MQTELQKEEELTSNSEMLEVGCLVRYYNSYNGHYGKSILNGQIGVITKIYHESPFKDYLVFMLDGQFLLDTPQHFELL